MAHDTILDATIAALVKQLAADAAYCATIAKEASKAMNEGERNLAIGTLMGAEVQIERLDALRKTIMALHGAGR